MYIRVATGGEISLQDTDNMRAFSIIEDSRGASRAQLAGIGEPTDDDHFWLDADAVLELSGRKQDEQWVEAYWNMLSSVAPYGYYDETTNRVKAHVEPADD